MNIYIYTHILCTNTHTHTVHTNFRRILDTIGQGLVRYDRSESDGLVVSRI